MRVSDVMEMARASSLFNLPVAKNDTALVKFIQLGLGELYRRFSLSVKVETIVTNPDLALYELRNPDVSLLLSVYNSNNQEMRETDVLGGNFDFKRVNFRSFILRHPKNDLVFAVYKATAPEITVDCDLDIPDAMIDALLEYVSYRGHSTINRDNINESSAYQRRFDESCRELEMQGYKIAINTQSVVLQARGFV